MHTNNNEFPVSINSDYGYGELLVTNLTVMLKPAPAGQYHKGAPHDMAFFAQIMDLGDYSNGFGITWRISTDLSAEDTHQLMKETWHAYFDGFCMGKTWIDANVIYVGADGEILFVKGYGFDDGDEQGTVFVYTKEFWLSINPNGDCVQANWTPLLKLCGFVNDDVGEPILLKELEEQLRKGSLRNFGNKIVVVQPSSDEIGYTARGFK